MADRVVVYRFGPFEVDASGRLSRAGNLVPLSAAESAILLQLVSRAGDIVLRDTLTKAAWGNSAVGENSLGKAISRLRRRLGGTDGTLYIETVSNHGYRLAVPVECVTRDVPDQDRRRADAPSLDVLLAPHRAVVEA